MTDIVDATDPGAQETEVFIASMSFKLIHEKSDPIRAAVDYAVHSDGNISDNILASQLQGIDKKGQKMINLAERGDFYAGLPDMYIGIEEAAPGILAHQRSRRAIIQEIPEKTPYPIVALRENQVFIGGNDLDNPIKDEKYLQTRRMMKKMNIKVKDLYRGMTGTEEEPNPDLDKLDDTFFSFSTDIYSTIESTLQYQWNFFDWLMGEAPIGEPVEPEPVVTAEGDLNFIEFAEYEDTENIFRCTLLFDYITKHTESNVYLKDPREGHEHKSVDYIKELIPAEEVGIGDPAGAPSQVIIKKQIAFGEVEVITIHNLHHRVIIDAKGEIKVVVHHLDEKFFNLPPEDELAGTGAFYIPMIMEIVELATNKHEQIALFDGSMLLLFVAEEIHLKWYQTTWFKVVMTIVSIVIQFIPIFGQALAFTLQNLMIAIFNTVILGMIIQLIMQEVVSKLGAFGVAIIVIGAFIYGGGMSLQGLPFATQLLKAVNVIFKSINMEDSIELIDEIKDFDKSYEEKQEELSEAAALLGPANSLDPTLLIEAYTQDAYEHPDDFYERTIHTGNPGVLSLDAIEEYVVGKLRLPEYRPDDLETQDGKTPLNENAAQMA